MRFLFITQGCLPIHHRSVEERPLGGIETGVIRLASELQKLGHEVIVGTTLAHPPLSEPLYVPLNAIGDIRAIDVLIVVRDWQPLLAEFDAKLKLFWTGDSYDQPQTLGLGDPRVMARCNALLTVSEWQADELSRRSGFPREKCWVIRNGVHLPHFEGAEPRRRRRMIYSSTPYRGLEFLPLIFRQIKSRIPDAELHIFSDFKVYEGAGDYPPEIVNRYQQLRAVLAQMPGCVFHGNVLQQQLAREFMQSSILCYPNIFEETSCITALEAQAAGCPIVTTNLGALPETVGDTGILLNPPVNSDAYKVGFINACLQLLTNDTAWQQLSNHCLARRPELGWDAVARRLMGFIESR
jgi:glycosyltransferase involved in cell wall biosynthesis